MNPNQALWEKGDFTRIAAAMRASGDALVERIGVAKGLGMIVARELIGVYEFVTAPFPAPAGYKPILQPEYPWDYFD